MAIDQITQEKGSGYWIAIFDAGGNEVRHVDHWEDPTESSIFALYPFETEQEAIDAAESFERF